MTPIEGKYEIELNYPGDGRLFLNFWDHMHGNDVFAEVKEGKLWQGEEDVGTEITVAEFLKQIEASIKMQGE